MKTFLVRWLCVNAALVTLISVGQAQDANAIKLPESQPSYQIPADAFPARLPGKSLSYKNFDYLVSKDGKSMTLIYPKPIPQPQGSTAKPGQSINFGGVNHVVNFDGTMIPSPSFKLPSISPLPSAQSTVYHQDNTYVVNADGSMSPVPHYLAPSVINISPTPGSTYAFGAQGSYFDKVNVVLNADGTVSPGSTGKATFIVVAPTSKSNPLTAPASKSLPLTFP